MNVLAALALAVGLGCALLAISRHSRLKQKYSTPVDHPPPEKNQQHPGRLSTQLPRPHSPPPLPLLANLFRAVDNVLMVIPAVAEAKRREEQAETARLQAEAIQNAPRILVLGPEYSGKSTLHRQAVSIAADSDAEKSQDNMWMPYAPTLGLVRRILALPTSTGTSTVLLCEAGGGRQQRRQWVELVRGTNVAALVFMLDAADVSEESRGLFAQLVGAPWAQNSAIFLVLTKVDLLSPQNAQSICDERDSAYRAVCRQPICCRRLTTTDATHSRALLREVVETVRH